MSHSAYEEFIIAINSIKDAVTDLRFGLPFRVPAEGKATLDVKTSSARALQLRLPTLPNVLPTALTSYQKIIEASDLRPSEKESARNFATQWKQRLEIRDLVAETVEARNSAVEAQQVARRAAGVVGEVKLSEHFGNYARRLLIFLDMQQSSHWLY